MIFMKVKVTYFATEEEQAELLATVMAKLQANERLSGLREIRFLKVDEVIKPGCIQDCRECPQFLTIQCIDEERT